jgi:hypothetical protein
MTQDQWNSLLVERASEMAHHRTIIDFILNLPYDKSFNEDDLYDKDEDDDILSYTEEVQDVFNYYYDEYFEQLINTYEIPIV